MISCKISLLVKTVSMTAEISGSAVPYIPQHPIGASLADLQIHNTEALRSVRNGFEQYDCEQRQHRAVGRADSFRQASQNSNNKSKEVQSL